MDDIIQISFIKKSMKFLVSCHSEEKMELPVLKLGGWCLAPQVQFVPKHKLPDNIALQQ